MQASVQDPFACTCGECPGSECTEGIRVRTYPLNIAGGDRDGKWLGDIECDVCRCEPISTDFERPARRSVAARDVAPAVMHSLAVLMLGHRSRLVFDSVPLMVVAPTVREGYQVGFFAFLENNAKTNYYNGGYSSQVNTQSAQPGSVLCMLSVVYRQACCCAEIRAPLSRDYLPPGPCLWQSANRPSHPVLRNLTDAALRMHIESEVTKVGGHIGRVLIAPRPTPPALPRTNWSQFRMWGFAPSVGAQYGVGSGISE
jgi:hypothetical protein